ncbi:Cys/Met metabolism PLP-dependent enzyme, partial [Helicosporidium sp. ATCC 50920]
MQCTSRRPLLHGSGQFAELLRDRRKGWRTPQKSLASLEGKIGPGNGGCYLYGRSFNPTVRYLGRQLAALEGAEEAYCTSSGMAAISAALLALCDSGDHIVASNTVYGGTYALLKEFFPTKCGISTAFVDVTDLSAVRAAITPRTRVIYCETVANPTLVVADLPALAEIAHGEDRAEGRRLALVVDNTFSAVAVSPLSWGADVVVHSLTKFISGASDVVAGAVCGSSALIGKLMDLHLGPLMLLGPTMDPRVASDLSLRMPHLALRVREHARRAAAYAERLERLGARVFYPGLASHPNHLVARKIFHPDYGFGGMLALDLEGRERASVFIEQLQNKHAFGLMAVSLGYFDTLLSISAASTSSEMTDEELREAGIAPGLVRMSVGFSGS